MLLFLSNSSFKTLHSWKLFVIKCPTWSFQHTTFLIAGCFFMIGHTKMTFWHFFSRPYTLTICLYLQRDPAGRLLRVTNTIVPEGTPCQCESLNFLIRLWLSAHYHELFQRSIRAPSSLTFLSHPALWIQSASKANCGDSSHNDLIGFVSAAVRS